MNNILYSCSPQLHGLNLIGGKKSINSYLKFTLISRDINFLSVSQNDSLQTKHMSKFLVLFTEHDNNNKIVEKISCPIINPIL